MTPSELTPMGPVYSVRHAQLLGARLPGDQNCGIDELAEPFQITKQGVSKHIQVLEAAGLISRSRDGQMRPCHLEPLALEALTEWIDTYRLVAEGRFRRLDSLLETMKEKER